MIIKVPLKSMKRRTVFLVGLFGEAEKENKNALEIVKWQWDKEEEKRVPGWQSLDEDENRGKRREIDVELELNK